MVQHPAPTDGFTDFEHAVFDALAAKHYYFERWVASGHTSRVARILHNDPDAVIKRHYMAKVPEDMRGSPSPTTLLNAAKRDLHRSELETQISLGVGHRNIAAAVQAIVVEGSPVLIYEDFDASSLGDVLQQRGQPFSDGQIWSAFSQLADGLQYLHREKLAHRDVKPGNCLVAMDAMGDDLTAKLCDLQNAGHTLKSERLAPTRGGTAYTLPAVLNALLSDRETHAGVGNDLYGLAACLYLSLTGEELSQRQLIFDPHGKEMQIGNERHKVSLVQDGKHTHTIDLDTERNRVQSKISTVDARYHPILETFLLQDGTSDDLDARMFRSMLKEVTHPPWYKTSGAKKLFRGMAIAGSLAVIMAGAGLIHHAMQPPDQIPFVPGTIYADYEGLSLGDTGVNEHLVNTLRANYVDIHQNVDAIRAGHEPHRAIINAADADIDVNKRFVHAITMAASRQDPAALQEQYGAPNTERFARTLAPARGFRRPTMDESCNIVCGEPITDPGMDLETIAALRRIQQCRFMFKRAEPRPRDDSIEIADTIACYFAKNGEQFSLAQELAGGGIPFHLFDGAHVRPGYIGFFPPIVQDLIMDALSLYLVTDASGHIHEDLFPGYGPVYLNAGSKHWNDPRVSRTSTLSSQTGALQSAD